MTDRLKIYRVENRNEFVQFDHNPEILKVKRAQTGGAPSRPRAAHKKSTGKDGHTGGSSGTMYVGTELLVITISKAHLVEPQCKARADTLLGWLSPVKAASSAKVDAGKPPDLVVQWGVGFTITATLATVDVSYVRVTSDGVPVHAVCDLTLKASPPPVPSLTNPTSGGRPGRNRHVVHADESLMSIATGAFGNPGAWRAIAEVNGVDDPRSIRPGDVLYLPAPDELHELSERSR